MAIRKHCGLAAFAFLAATATAPAFATESGVYLGLSIGNSKFDLGEEGPLGIFDTTTSSSTDDSDTGLMVALGYRFNPYFGLEASYVDFGKATLNESGRFFGSPTNYTASVDAGVSGLALSLVGAIPVGNFEIGMKLGLLKADTELSVTASGGGQSASDSESASTTETLIAFGAGYTFGNHFQLRLDYSMVQDAGDEEETGEGDVEMLTLGAQYRF